MNDTLEPHTRLPVRYPLTLLYVLSLLVTALVAAASCAGLLARSWAYPAGELVQAFVPTDAVNLVIGVPILLGSLWLSRRGKLLGLLLWPGALMYVLYNELVYLLVMPFNGAFLLHLALVTLTLYTLVGLIAGMDGKTIGRRLAGSVPERLAGGIVAGLGLLFFLRVVIVAASALANGTPVARTEQALHVADVLLGPAAVCGGLLLWRRQPLGYVAGLALLFQLSMLFIGLITVLVLQPFLTDTPFAPVDVLVVAVMGLICFVPTGLFVRGVLRAQASPVA